MKYGDQDKVPNDVKTLLDILDLPGSSILIDVLAESVSATASKFKISDPQR